MATDNAGNFSALSGSVLVTVAETPQTDSLIANSGVQTVGAPPTGAGIQEIALDTLSVTDGTTVKLESTAGHANRMVLVLGNLSLPGLSTNWTGLLDLGDNDLVLENASLSVITSQLATGYDNGEWNGPGISSTTAAGDSAHLAALGVLLNNDGSGNPLYGSTTALGMFDGVNPNTDAVLVKYTYYGDANLDGVVDGSDFSRIDNGFENHLTGWSNGDFNYDGVVDGSDYTLIDNAFNTQGATLASQLSSPDAMIAPLRQSKHKAAISSASGTAFSTVALNVASPAKQSIEALLQKKDLLDGLQGTK